MDVSPGSLLIMLVAFEHEQNEAVYEATSKMIYSLLGGIARDVFHKKLSRAKGRWGDIYYFDIPASRVWQDMLTALIEREVESPLNYEKVTR